MALTASPVVKAPVQTTGNRLTAVPSAPKATSPAASVAPSAGTASPAAVKPIANAGAVVSGPGGLTWQQFPGKPGYLITTNPANPNEQVTYDTATGQYDVSNPSYGVVAGNSSTIAGAQALFLSLFPNDTGKLGAPTSSVTTATPGKATTTATAKPAAAAAAPTVASGVVPLISSIGAPSAAGTTGAAGTPAAANLANPYTLNDSTSSAPYTSGASGDDSGIGSGDTSLPPPSTADVEALQPTPATTTSSGPSTAVIVVIAIVLIGALAWYFLYYEKKHKKAGAPAGGGGGAES